MSSALLSRRKRRVDVMKGYEPMYDATMQELSAASVLPVCKGERTLLPQGDMGVLRVRMVRRQEYG